MGRSGGGVHGDGHQGVWLPLTRGPPFGRALRCLVLQAPTRKCNRFCRRALLCFKHRTFQCREELSKASISSGVALQPLRVGHFCRDRLRAVHLGRSNCHAISGPLSASPPPDSGLNWGFPTEGPSWGYPLDVLGAVWTLLRKIIAKS